MATPPNIRRSSLDAGERFADYRQAVHLIGQHRTVGRCEALDRLVTPDWYERVYVPRQHNIHLVRNKPLPGELLGLVVRRDLEWRGTCRGVFLIQVAPQRSSFVEHFVIAHELGHVLAHGSLMYAGMVISEPAWDCPAEEHDRRQLVELEANICALMAIVPHRVIDTLAKALDRPVDPCTLQAAMQWLAGEPFDFQLARERMLLHATLERAATLNDFKRIVYESERSWTFHGAAALGMTAHTTALQCAARTTEAQLQQWLALLCGGAMISPSEWPQLRKLAKPKSPPVDITTSAPP